MNRFNKFPLNAFLILILSISVISQTPNSYEDYEYSLAYPYTNPNWYFVGSAMASDTVVLTQDLKSQEGGIWCNAPVMFRDWEIHVQFKIFGHGQTLFGDGLALWYVKEPNQRGPVFGSKNFFSGLGIFLDTYKNSDDQYNKLFPYINAQVSDGTREYKNNLDGMDAEIAGFSTNFRGEDKQPILIISYINNELQVKISYDHLKTIETCFHVKGIHLPTGYHFGASSATGDLSDKHMISSFKVYPVHVEHKDQAAESPKADFFTPPRDHMAKPIHTPMTTKKLILIIILGIIGLAVLFVVGLIVFKKQEESRKRLY